MAQVRVFIFGDRPTKGGMPSADRPLQLADGAAQRRPTALRLALLRPAVHALKGRVVPLAADEGADDRQPIHHAGQPRQMLADLDAGDTGGDRLELAADFGRRVGFEIDHVLMRRPAGQEDHDDGLVRGA